MTETLLFLGFTGLVASFVAVFIVWTFLWKGLALWTAARKGSKIWFIVLLFVNTLTILEVLYVLYFSKRETLKNVDEKFDKATEKVVDKFTKTEENN